MVSWEYYGLAGLVILWPVASVSVFPTAAELASLRQSSLNNVGKTDTLKRALIGHSMTSPTNPNTVALGEIVVKPSGTVTQNYLSF
jgi:hypothetical protein